MVPATFVDVNCVPGQSDPGRDRQSRDPMLGDSYRQTLKKQKPRAPARPVEAPGPA